MSSGRVKASVLGNEEEVGMRQVRNVLIVALGIAIAGLAGATVSAQTTTTGTEFKTFEVLVVDGNRVVVRGDNGVTQEITVPDDFRLTVDGNPVAARDLKPGMKGIARITTTTTVTPVSVTEVKKGKVLKVAGSSIIVRTDNDTRMFTQDEVNKRGVRINGRDGKPIQFSDLREGYELTATIVTQGPPHIMTQREVDAALASVPAPPRADAPARVASTNPTPSGTVPPTPAPRLPKTAGPLPLFNLVGTAALVLAGILRTRRRRG
jgi:hypothetical protein